MNSRLLEHRVCRQTCAWVRCLVCFRSSKCSSCLQQQMQGLDSHKHLMPYLGLRDASLLLKVRLPVRMLLSGSCISSDAVKPKFPLTPGAEELPSPAAGGAGELRWEHPKLPCPLQSREAAAALQQPRWEVFFPLTLQQIRRQELCGAQGMHHS